MTTAKIIQFARLSGLLLCDEEGNEPVWFGTGRQFQEFRELQAKDDRGEFYQRYPWQVIEF